MADTTDLRRPFPADAVKFKLQTSPRDDNGYAVITAYIDARDAMARLDTVAPGKWQDDYEVVPGFALICRITVDGITRTDATALTGEATDMAVKGAFSDAFKRAAVKFGVGSSLYALKAPRLKGSSLGSYTRKDGSKAYSLSDTNLEYLRGGYEKWLKANESQWGEPLGVAAVIDDAAADENRIEDLSPPANNGDDPQGADTNPQVEGKGGKHIGENLAGDLLKAAVASGETADTIYMAVCGILDEEIEPWNGRDGAVAVLSTLTPEQAKAFQEFFLPPKPPDPPKQAGVIG